VNDRPALLSRDLWLLNKESALSDSSHAVFKNVHRVCTTAAMQ
jgi:hypothetical protein